jgi:hypothetical protein
VSRCRTIVQTASEQHVCEWAGVPDGTAADDLATSLREAMSSAVAAGALISFRLQDGTRRLIPGRAIEWIDVEVQ